MLFIYRFKLTIVLALNLIPLKAFIYLLEISEFSYIIMALYSLFSFFFISLYNDKVLPPLLNLIGLFIMFLLMSFTISTFLSFLLGFYSEHLLLTTFLIKTLIEINLTYEIFCLASNEKAWSYDKILNFLSAASSSSAGGGSDNSVPSSSAGEGNRNNPIPVPSRSPTPSVVPSSSTASNPVTSRTPTPVLSSSTAPDTVTPRTPTPVPSSSTAPDTLAAQPRATSGLDTSSYYNLGQTLGDRIDRVASSKQANHRGIKKVYTGELGLTQYSREHYMLQEVFSIYRLQDGPVNKFAYALSGPRWDKAIIWSSEKKFGSPGDSLINLIRNHR